METYLGVDRLTFLYRFRMFKVVWNSFLFKFRFLAVLIFWNFGCFKSIIHLTVCFSNSVIFNNIESVALETKYVKNFLQSGSLPQVFENVSTVSSWQIKYSKWNIASSLEDMRLTSIYHLPSLVSRSLSFQFSQVIWIMRGLVENVFKPQNWPNVQVR